MATLTQRSVENLEPRKAPFEVRDTGGKGSIKGLLLRVQPSGSKTSYVEIERGKRERIGNASAFTLDKARTKAILGKAADGHDFQAERRQKKILSENTLRAYLDGPFQIHAEANIVSHRCMLPDISGPSHHECGLTRHCDASRVRPRPGGSGINSVTRRQMQRHNQWRSHFKAAFGCGGEPSGLSCHIYCFR